MPRHAFVALVSTLVLAWSTARAQTGSAPRVAIPRPIEPAPAVNSAGGTSARWHSPGGGPSARVALASGSASPTVNRPADDGVAPLEPLAPVGATPGQPIARVKEGIDTLPNEHGQIWREYDITPYTLRVTSTKRPEQAIVDWIFRDTGYEVWHSDVCSVLSADNRTLKVYHTPQIQNVVGDLVDRFVNSEAETHGFGIRVVTLDHPSWRSKAQRLMKAVPVQTPGVQAWIMAKEDAALLMAELRKRTDYREHSSPQLLVNNGQSTVVASTRPRAYVKDLIARPGLWPGFQAEMGQLDEGFSLDFSPLLSRDQRMIDAAIKCNIDQVERLTSVVLEVPTPVAQNQRTQVEVPQMCQYRLHERFRWPAEQVLLVGLGMVATPVPTDPTTLQTLTFSGPARADMLIFLESKGKLGQAPSAIGTAQRDPNLYRGRY